MCWGQPGPRPPAWEEEQLAGRKQAGRVQEGALVQNPQGHSVPPKELDSSPTVSHSSLTRDSDRKARRGVWQMRARGHSPLSPSEVDLLWQVHFRGLGRCWVQLDLLKAMPPKPPILEAWSPTSSASRDRDGESKGLTRTVGSVGDQPSARQPRTSAGLSVSGKRGPLLSCLEPCPAK